MICQKLKISYNKYNFNADVLLSIHITLSMMYGSVRVLFVIEVCDWGRGSVKFAKDLKINCECEKNGFCITVIIVNITFCLDVYSDLFHWHLYWVIINNYQISNVWVHSVVRVQ
jgi:hypothetical protein